MKKTKTKKQKQWVPREAFQYSYKDPTTGQLTPRRAFMWKKEVYIEWFEYAKLAQSLGYKIPKEFGDLSKFKKFDDWWKPPFFAADLFMEPAYDKSVLEVDCNNYTPTANKLVVELDLNRSQNQLKFDLRNLVEKLDTAKKYVPVARFQPSKTMKDLRLKKAEHEHNEKKDLPVRMCNPRRVYEFTQQGLTQAEIAHHKELRFFEGTAEVKAKDKHGNYIRDKDGKFKTYQFKVTNDDVYKWKLTTTGRGNKTKLAFPNTPDKDEACELRYLSACRRVSRNLRQCKEIFKSIEKGTFP